MPRGRRSEDKRCEPGDTGPRLDEARAGDSLIVTGIDDDRARITALRFGMSEGARVHCVTRIPAGPIVLRSGRQEIAVGRALARRISVRPADAGSAADSGGPVPA